MELLEKKRRSRILTKAQFGCLRDAYTINVTRGCEFLCTYCYARGYPGAPFTGQVYVYRNLPRKLAEELDNPRRRSETQRVVFNTASDSFQTHPTILDISYRTMKLLLERGIGFSFLTKGWIPDRFIQLFSDYADLVYARIGLVSLSPRYRDLFEPFTATAQERLQNIIRLQSAGVNVEVRVDPIIPFYTDDEASIKKLYEALASRNIRTVTLSYLHLRPPVMDQLQRELPPIEYNVIHSCFASKPWTQVGTSSRSKLIPSLLREKGYRRFINTSKDYGISAFICSCKNPDLSKHRCLPEIEAEKGNKRGGKERRQLSLFPC